MGDEWNDWRSTLRYACTAARQSGFRMRVRGYRDFEGRWRYAALVARDRRGAALTWRTIWPDDLPGVF